MRKVNLFQNGFTLCMQPRTGQQQECDAESDYLKAHALLWRRKIRGADLALHKTISEERKRWPRSASRRRVEFGCCLSGTGISIAFFTLMGRRQIMR
jgi:hypothetical protein